jgi:DNA-binding IclR family transcriptional regulator
MRAKTTYSVPALDRGLDILETLAAADVPQSLTDLAHALQRTPSELFRTLAALEQRAYIGRDAVSEGYSLTLKLYELAHTHSPVDQLLRAAAQPMRELAESIRESCHLSILNGQSLTVIAQAESPEPVRLSVEVGYRVAPLSTASGTLLVAMLRDAEQKAFLAVDAGYAKMGRGERKRLAKQLVAIRDAGTHLAESTRRTGSDIACVVGNPETGVLAALGVPLIPGGVNQGRERKLVPIIEKHAERITAALGLAARKRH